MKTKRESRTRLMGVTGEDLVRRSQSPAWDVVRGAGLLTRMPPEAR